MGSNTSHTSSDLLEFFTNIPPCGFWFFHLSIVFAFSDLKYLINLPVGIQDFVTMSSEEHDHTDL